MQEKNVQITPDIAGALLEYISMEDCRTKSIITVLAKSEIDRYLSYVDTYAKSLNISQEGALQSLIADK